MLRPQMKSRALSIALCAVMSAAGLRAEPETLPVTVRGVTFQGNGCGPGSAVDSFDESRTRVTLIFSANLVAAGQGMSAGDTRRRCEIGFALTVKPGQNEQKALLVVRGHATLPAGAAAEVLTDWSGGSSSARNEERATLVSKGDEGGDDGFVITREIVLDASPSLTVQTSLVLTRGTDALMTIDSVDLAIGKAPYSATFEGPDTTPPIITADPSGDRSASGWYSGDVLVSFRCEDPESPIVPELSDLEPKLVTDTGSAKGECVNVTGNSSAVTLGVRIDRARPRIVGGHYPGAGWIALGAHVPSGLACVDEDSGIESCLIPGWLDTSKTGLHTISAVAWDRAGHDASATSWYYVGDAGNCSEDGWRQFAEPMFRDEYDCVSRFQSVLKGQ
jgi:hypothetical protein